MFDLLCLLVLHFLAVGVLFLVFMGPSCLGRAALRVSSVCDEKGK